MSPRNHALVLLHLGDLSHYEDGESTLMPVLMRWLAGTGRLRMQTRVAYEVPWLGRRVDLALITGRGVTSAFELKIGRLQRVLEQAAYNRSAFHRSWVVTANRPRVDGLRWARELGVGLLVVQGGVVTPLVAPAIQRPHPAAIKRLRASILTRSVVHD